MSQRYSVLFLVLCLGEFHGFPSCKCLVSTKLSNPKVLSATNILVTILGWILNSFLSPSIRNTINDRL